MCLFILLYMYIYMYIYMYMYIYGYTVYVYFLCDVLLFYCCIYFIVVKHSVHSCCEGRYINKALLTYLLYLLT